MEDITIAEARAKKLELEQKLDDVLTEFSRTTGLVIDRIVFEEPIVIKETRQLIRYKVRIDTHL